MRGLELVLSSAAVLLGLWLIAAALLRKGPGHGAQGDPATGVQAIRTKQIRPLRVSARSLGLACRGAARLLRSRRQVADSELLFLERYTRAVDTRRFAFVAPHTFWTVVDATPPLLELEQLLERLDNFSARVRSWGAGRRRERS